METLAAAEVQNKLYWLFIGNGRFLIAPTVPAAFSLLRTIQRSIDIRDSKWGKIEDELSSSECARALFPPGMSRHVQSSSIVRPGLESLPGTV